MKNRFPLSFFAVLALAACDAAVVASAQSNDPPSTGVAAEATAQADASEKTFAKVEHSDAAKADVEATIEPAAFDLETVSFLVKKGKVKDAKALEKQINNPKEKINNVDIDGDGKIDKIQVVEVRDEATGVVVFELRAIPSTTKDKDTAILVASINFTPDKVSKKLVVRCVYAPVVIGYATIVHEYVVPIEVKGDVVVVVDSSPFHGWLFTVNRPVYYGVFVYEVAPPPVIIIEHDGCWPPGHCKGHKYKHKGKGKHWH